MSAHTCCTHVDAQVNCHKALQQDHEKLQRVAIREEQEIRDEAAIAAEVDLSEMVGDFNDDEGETSGMQIASPEELEPSGFEDVDLSEMLGED